MDVTAAPYMQPAASRRRSGNELLAILVLVVALLGPAAAAAAQTEQPADLTGVYTVTIGRPDLPPGLPGSASLVGLWTIAFNGDGTYAMDRQDVGRVASGTYELAGSTLVFNDWAGIIGCGTPTAETGPASYAWRLDDAGLTLTPIDETCSDRRVLLGTRSFASYEACTTTPFGSSPLGAELAGTPSPNSSGATPVAGGVSAQEGLTLTAEPQDAIDRLLRQATGCWATGDPARFLPLHSEAVLTELSALGPLPDFASTLRSVMTVPLSFQRIGDLTLVDPTTAWCYVEVTLGGEPLPQRMDFVYENGQWLLDTFFLFGPASDADPTMP